MLADFGQSVMLFVFIGILIAIGIYVQAQIGIQIASVAGNNSTADNASKAAIAATATFPSWLQIIAVVIGAAVVLGILARVFGFNLGNFGSAGY